MDGAIPFRLLYRMMALSNIYMAFASYKAGSIRLADWAKQYPSYCAIVKSIIQMRNNHAR